MEDLIFKVKGGPSSGPNRGRMEARLVLKGLLTGKDHGPPTEKRKRHLDWEKGHDLPVTCARLQVSVSREVWV